MRTIPKNLFCAPALAIGVISLAICCAVGLAAEPSTGAASEPAAHDSEQVTPPPSASRVDREVSIEAPAEEAASKQVPWLGLSTIEVSDALAAQLNLGPGVGLLITYVAPEGPAAKGGLRKNDVLVEFGEQALVHPAQLRKLVRVQNDGAVVRLGYYRAGKHDVVSVTLGTTKDAVAWSDDQDHPLKGTLEQLHRQMRDLHLDETMREQMRALRESLGNIKIDQKEVQESIRRGMEQARTAIQEALRNVTNSDPMRKVLDNLAHSGIIVDDRANVVVRNSGKNVRSLVKSDDDGTIVLVSNPRLYLTAHDKAGNLLFDGPIEAAEERAKVPKQLWERVEPLLEQMRQPVEQEEPGPDEDLKSKNPKR